MDTTGGILSGPLGLTTDGLFDETVAEVVVVEQFNPYTVVAERRWGRDLLLTLPEVEVTPTPSGDWPTVAGRDNLDRALIRRSVSNRTLRHRPQYGGNLEASVGRSAAPANVARAAQDLRMNLMRDPRLEDAKVSAQGQPDGQVLVELSVRPAGESDAGTVAITVAGG